MKKYFLEIALKIYTILLRKRNPQFADLSSAHHRLWWAQVEKHTFFYTTHIDLMRKLFVAILAVILTGCGQLNLLNDNSQKCRGSLMNDCFNKKEKNLAANKPNPEGEWGLVFVRDSSLQASLVRRKALALGCARAARKYHNRSVLAEKVGPGKYEYSGCDLIETDIYPEEVGEATLYHIQAWVGIPIGKTARRWREKVRPLVYYRCL